jgi:hypothetical protein
VICFSKGTISRISWDHAGRAADHSCWHCSHARGIGARLTAFAGDHREPANASMTCEGPLEVIGTP